MKVSKYKYKQQLNQSKQTNIALNSSLFDIYNSNLMLVPLSVYSTRQAHQLKL